MALLRQTVFVQIYDAQGILNKKRANFLEEM